MGQCRILDQGNLTHNLGNNPPVNYHIDMGEYGYSTGRPLFTWGALPCLIIVVHNITNDRGCLAHKSHNSIDQTVLFNDAVAATQTMLQACGNPAHSNIFLLAGQAFIPGSHYAPNNPQATDIVTHLQNLLGANHSVWNGLHHGLGQAFYYPQQRTLYNLSPNEVTNAQNTMIDNHNAPLWARLTPGWGVARL